MADISKPLTLDIRQLPTVREAPAGVQITIKQPGPEEDAITGPWLWLEVHAERGVHLDSTIHGPVKLDRRQLGTLHTAIGHILEEGVEHVTAESMTVALGE